MVDPRAIGYGSELGPPTGYGTKRRDAGNGSLTPKLDMQLLKAGGSAGSIALMGYSTSSRSIGSRSTSIGYSTRTASISSQLGRRSQGSTMNIPTPYSGFCSCFHFYLSLYCS